METIAGIVSEPVSWLVIVYILVKEVLPKLAPDLVKAWSNKKSTEDRLFELLEKNTAAIEGLRTSMETVGIALMHIDRRVDQLETLLRDDGTAAFIKWFKTLPEYRRLQASDGVTNLKGRPEPD